jgi:hypothetical protein
MKENIEIFLGLKRKIEETNLNFNKEFKSNLKILQNRNLNLI